jgi:hypothetical protein
MTLLFSEDPGFSQFKNSSIRDLNRIYQIVKNPDMFRSNYNSLINGIIKGLNTQLSQYKAISHDAIKEDIREAVRQNYDNDRTSDELRIALDNNIKPFNKYNYKEIPPPPEYDFDFDDEPIVSMYEYMPPADKTQWNKSDKKEFVRYQKQAVEGIKEFLKHVDNFESTLCKYRENVVRLMNNNLQYFIGEHYNYAYEIKNKLRKVSDEKLVKVCGKDIKLVPSQKGFLKKAIDSVL